METCSLANLTQPNEERAIISNGNGNEKHGDKQLSEGKRRNSTGTVDNEAAQTSGLGHGPKMIAQRTTNRARFGAKKNDKGMQKGQTISGNRFKHLLSEDSGDIQSDRHVVENVSAPSTDSALMRAANNYSKK